MDPHSAPEICFCKEVGRDLKDLDNVNIRLCITVVFHFIMFYFTLVPKLTSRGVTVISGTGRVTSVSHSPLETGVCKKAGRDLKGRDYVHYTKWFNIIAEIKSLYSSLVCQSQK